MKLRCRKGIPSSLRAKAWQYLSNSKELLEQNPGKFEVCPGYGDVTWCEGYHQSPPDPELIPAVPLQELERAPGDPKWLDVIEKDLHRQFPFHEMFAARGGHG